jgi:hypothetical protein
MQGMRNKISLATAILLIGMSLLFSMCKKTSTPGRIIQQKLACDVARYMVTINQPQALFQKTYDAAGKSVTEISCSFFEPGFDVFSEGYFGHQHDLLVTKSGSSLILLDKNDPADTAMMVYFNKDGRPASSITNLAGNITDNYLHGDTENFAYKGSRVFSVETLGAQVDTVRYDSLGNVLSFAGNNNIYDYDRQAAESFYITDFQQTDHGYYLLQYLGYFPEVTNTTNIRSNTSNSYWKVQVNNGSERYDSVGRVIEFLSTYVYGAGNNPNFFGLEPATAVTYHCQ